jgi:hypothetical protein
MIKGVLDVHIKQHSDVCRSVWIKSNLYISALGLGDNLQLRNVTKSLFKLRQHFHDNRRGYRSIDVE